MKTILIITNSFDIHVDFLVEILEKKGQSFFRINLDKFPREYLIKQLYIDGDLHSSIEHIPSQKHLDLNHVISIWNRKPAPFAFISDDLAAQEIAYAQEETKHALFGLLYPLNCYWMSHPVSLRGAMWKGEQLNRANKLGFRIPKSLVTNNPSDVKAFKSKIKTDMIFKSLSTPDLASVDVDDEDRISEGLATTIVTDEMMDNLDSVREVPCHFQEYIPKKYELRITIVGNKIFAAKIHSQDDDRTKIDSRDMSAEILYEPTKLPKQVEDKCFNLVSSYNLNYSALDIIVTPEDEYVFLENNPNGQFLYIEQLIPEFNILETVSDSLIGAISCTGH